MTCFQTFFWCSSLLLLERLQKGAQVFNSLKAISDPSMLELRVFVQAVVAVPCFGCLHVIWNPVGVMRQMPHVVLMSVRRLCPTARYLAAPLPEID